jgi:hypothetical protein
MVRRARLSIAGLMGIVLVASLGLTALRSGTEIWAGATLLATSAVLALAVVGVVCRSGPERSWWLGFALFGWGYLGLVFLWPQTSLVLPTSALLKLIRPSVGPIGMGGGGGGGGFGGGFGGMGLYIVYDAYSQAGHSLFSLVVAAVGGVLAVRLFGGQAAPPESVAGPTAEARAPRHRWRRFAIAVPAAVAVVLVALAGLRWVPGPLSAATLCATWGLLGLAVVGAICRPGRSRAAWLGAALFGIGYMTLIFNRDPESAGWPRAGTDQLLRALRPTWYVGEFPPTSAIAGTNAWIREALERPISMHFPNETLLEDALKAIRDATRSPDGRSISIYVDPIGLQEAEKTMQSPVTLNLEGVVARTALGLILNQIGMRSSIQEGVLIITSDTGPHRLPDAVDADPYLSVGHCLLALLAAGLGAGLAQRFCTPREESAAQAMSI